MQWIPHGWAHTQTRMDTLTEESWDPDGILLQGAAMPRVMQPMHSDSSDKVDKFHRLGSYYSCSEMHHSTKAGKDYELKRFLP